MSTLRINIGRGVFWQGVSILSSFFTVPLSIEYLGKDGYGSWVVLYAFIMMLVGCDLGIPSAARNLITKAVTEKRYSLVSAVISTTYVCLASLSFLLALVAILLSFKPELWGGEIPIWLILAVLFFTILDYNLKFIYTVYTAHQQSYYLPFITAVINILNLIFIAFVFFIGFGGDDKIYYYCLSLPLISVSVNFICTVIAYKFTFVNVRPKLKYYDATLIKPLFIGGGAFFIIQIGMIILAQYSSILIFQYSSSEFIADLAILDKFFGVISVVGSAFLFPFWSKFTQKNALGDYVWIKTCLRKLEILFIVVSVFVIVLWYGFPFILKLWMLDENANISNLLSAIVATKYLAILLNSIYCYYLNGIGKLKIQIVMYSLGAILLIPCSSFLFEYFGVFGVVCYPVVVYSLMALMQRFYIKYNILKEGK